ncbi:hypothetical protein MN116_003186 [Schistosoma mekongi]|uniref:Uncharacterized protein n=1 Tax=Schistosoma mekongi TaxID=38744 RepID=A0AAE1ZGU9_SCHME|nr:hypothetical protein MN116_003186 [Schistosoma mekongi]
MRQLLSKTIFVYHIIFLSIWFVSFHVIICKADYDKHSNDQVDSGYKDSVEQEIVKAPLSFMPVCKPQQIHTFSQKQIRCACGIKCRFLCQTKTTKEKGAQEKTCRRVCRQKPCYRPAQHKVYHYSLAGGLCRMWNVCTYHAKCEGRTRRWVQYHLTSCQRASGRQYKFWFKDM